MKIQRFMTWALAATLAGVAGFAVLSFTAPTNLSFTAPASAVNCDFLPPDDPRCAPPPESDIQCVLKTADPLQLMENQSALVTYTVEIRNNGPDDAEGVVVTDLLPLFNDAGLTNATVNAGTDGICTGDNETQICNLGTVGASQTKFVTILLDVSNPQVSDIYVNIASVSSSTADTNGNNNGGAGTSCQVDIDVVPPAEMIADLECLGKTVNPTGDLIEGDAATLTYVVTVRNNGPETATNVMVVDNLPAGVTFVSANPSSGSCDAAPANVLTCDLGSLVNGQVGSVTIVVDVPGGSTTAGTPLLNSATVSGDETDLVSNNSCQASTGVVPGGGDNACTPGFWRNHTEQWVNPPADPDDMFGAEFGVSFPQGNVQNDMTLLAAVHLGGGQCKKLLRHGTAAYLNALFGGFSLNVAEVTQKIQDAFTSGNCQPEANEFGVLNDNKICLAE